MAAKKAKTPSRKTTKTPPKNKSKSLNRISLSKRSRGEELGDPDDLGENFDEEGLDLGPELDPEADYSAEEADFSDMGLPPDAEHPPLRPRPTRRANKHTIFPAPPTFSMTWDQGRQYWKSLWDHPECRPRLRVYIYRWFPAMLEGNRQVARLDGDAPDSQPDKQAKPLTIQEILHRYGTGDYGFKINDSGAGNQQIAQFKLVDRADMRDWENHPPILDKEGLDLSDPINATYIKQMKSRQKWDSDEEKEENMQAMERMAERMVKMAERQSERRPPEDSSKAAEVVAHAATLGQDLLAKSVERLMDSRGGSGPTDTMAMVTALVELVKGMKGENQLEIISTVMQRAAEAERAAYNAQIQGLNNTVQQLMARMDERKANPEAADDPLDRYRKMIEMKDIMGDLFDKGARSASREPAWMQYMPLLAPALNSLPVLVNGLVQRWGAPAAPNTPQAGQHPGATPPRPPTANPGQLPGTSQEQQAVMALLEQLRPPLLRYLNEGRSGYDFATLYIDWFGEEDYNRISSQPPEIIMQILASYPPIWGDIAPRQQQVLQFLEEFVSEPPDTSDTGTDNGDEDQQSASSVSVAKPNGSIGRPNEGVPVQSATIANEPEKKAGKRART